MLTELMTNENDGTPGPRSTDSQEVSNLVRAVETNGIRPPGVVPITQHDNSKFSVSLTATIRQLAIEPGEDYVEVFMENELDRIANMDDDAENENSPTGPPATDVEGPSAIQVFRADDVDPDSVTASDSVRKIRQPLADTDHAQLTLPKKKTIYEFGIEDPSEYDNDNPYLLLPVLYPEEDAFFSLEPLGYADDVFGRPVDQDEYEPVMGADLIVEASEQFDADGRALTRLLTRIAQLVTPRTLKELSIPEVAEPTTVNWTGRKVSIHYLPEGGFQELTLNVFRADPAVAEAAWGLHTRNATSILEQLIASDAPAEFDHIEQTPLADPGVGALVIPHSPAADDADVDETEQDSVDDDAESEEQPLVEIDDRDQMILSRRAPAVDASTVESVAMAVGEDQDDLVDALAAMAASVTAADVNDAALEVSPVRVPFEPPFDQTADYDTVAVYAVPEGTVVELAQASKAVDDRIALAVREVHTRQAEELLSDLDSSQSDAVRSAVYDGEGVVLPVVDE